MAVAAVYALTSSLADLCLALPGSDKAVSARRRSSRLAQRAEVKRVELLVGEAGT